jgi:hypothetical protein
MMSDEEYTEHQRIASGFSSLILGTREVCGCEQCEEKDAYIAMQFQMIFARS